MSKTIVTSTFISQFAKILMALFAVHGLSACMQSNAATEFESGYISTDDSISATDNTIKLVNSVFYQNFMGGDWRYKGSIRQRDTINAYIQIPEQLNMSQEEQENYLKLAICPSANNLKLWQEIKDSKLAVHIYTYKRKYSTYAMCDNPLV